MADVQLTGPLFDPGVVKKFRKELEEGVHAVGEEGEGVLMGFISKAGFQSSGRFMQSVDTEKGRKDITSIVVVTDDWAHQGRGRPTKTWFERGQRGGVRLRKGGWGFKNTAKRLNAMDLNEFFSDRIPRVLG